MLNYTKTTYFCYTVCMSDTVCKEAKIELVGATCTSCAIGIEHMGKKLQGVVDVWVDKQNSCVHVEYDGDVTVLEKICDFIFRIGYQASIIQTG